MKWLSRLARRFGSARALCVALLFALVFLRITDPRAARRTAAAGVRSFQVLKPRDATQRPVVIVDIDEESLRKLGQWPWPRTRVADLVTRLTELGAAAIAFDVVFAEPDRLSPALAADDFRDLDEETRDKLRALPSNDEVLAEAMRQSRVVLGETGLPTAVPQPEVQPRVGRRGRTGRRSEAVSVRTFPGCCATFRFSSRPPPGAALFSIRPSATASSGACRWSCRRRATIMPSLTFEMLRVVTGSSTILIRMDEAGVNSVAMPGFEMPTDRNGQLWVHFARHDPGALRLGDRCAGRPRRRATACRAGWC